MNNKIILPTMLISYLIAGGLPSTPKDIIQYVEKSNNNKKKKFNFWKLLESNE